MKTINNALLPCPFCGGKATLREPRPGKFDVRCENFMIDKCLMYVVTHNLFIKESDAAAAWNRRAI